jgi:replication factor C small subunit
MENRENFLPWTEKYRPKKLKEVVGHKEIVKRLEAYVAQKNMPSLLFAGPAGVGKTVCALALANELFKDSVNQNLMELNASDERGIDIIRGKIKDFAAILPYGEANFKLIFLDEADALTNEAQSALRRTMETYASTCRFVFSANYSSRIIEPIQSRCALFRFKPLSESEIIHRLKYICNEEKLHVSDDALSALVYVSEGDMRKAINFLQTAATLGEKISEETIFKVASKAKPKEVKELIELGLNGEFEKARNKLDTLLFEYGMSGEDVMLQIYRELIDSNIDQRKKIEIIDRLGEYNFRLTEGANERIQLEAFIAYLTLTGQNSTKQK